MSYKRVYAPDGEPFDVPEIRANHLILQKGWTQQPSVLLESNEKDKKPRRRVKPAKEQPESSED